MIYPILNAAFLIFGVVAALACNRNKISTSTMIWTVAACFTGIAIVHALNSLWFFAAFNALLAASLPYLKFRRDRQLKKELQAKMKRFERELEEYREKRNAARAATGEAN